MQIPKEYELIKEYPGSQLKGSIFSNKPHRGVYTHEVNGCSVSIPSREVENYPEFWKQIPTWLDAVSKLKCPFFGVVDMQKKISKNYEHVLPHMVRKAYVKNPQNYEIIELKNGIGIGSKIRFKESSNRNLHKVMSIRWCNTICDFKIITRPVEQDKKHFKGYATLAMIELAEELSVEERIDRYVEEMARELTSCENLLTEQIEVFNKIKENSPDSFYIMLARFMADEDAVLQPNTKRNYTLYYINSHAKLTFGYASETLGAVTFVDKTSINRVIDLIGDELIKYVYGK